MNHGITLGEKLKTNTEASTYMPSGIFAKELEDELMKFTTSYEDCKVNTRLAEQSEEVQGNANVEVDITDFTKSGGRELVAAEHHDTTESSSSFGNSDTDNIDPLDDSEIMSEFHGAAASYLGFDGFGEPFRARKKRVTDHWRSFIQPLMWRCKWTELQIRKFESQSRKYDKELEEYSRRKNDQLQNHSLEGLGVKSLHFTSSDPRNGVYMRKKRKRSEDSMDIASFMSRHNLFSYHESKRSSGKGFLKDDELKNRAMTTQKVKINVDNELWVNDEQLFPEPGGGDNPLEVILGKIEFLRLRVVKMKSRVENVMSENAGKLSFMDDSSMLMPFSALIASHQNTSPNNGDKMPVRTCIALQLKMEHNMSDTLVPENGVTSNNVIPGVNGSTNHVSYAYKKGEEDILIDNKRVKEEMNSFEEVKIEPIRSPLALKEELAGTNPQVRTAANPPTSNKTPPIMRSMSKPPAPKTQRKNRKRRGAGQRR